VIAKKPGESLYVVEWEDGSETTVKEQQLMEKDIEKFCEFWERELKLIKPRAPIYAFLNQRISS
jgi:hypothetical protein